jgi:protein TonB
MSALAHEAGAVSGRTSVLLLTTALHAVLIAGLLTARAMTKPDPGPAPLQSWIDVSRKQPKPTPVSTPLENSRWSPRQTELPAPMPQFEAAVSIPIPMEPGPQIPGIIAVPDPVPPTVVTTAMALRSTRSPDEFYPAASIRNNEAGAVIVAVCVSALGELTGRPQISASSGHPRLDTAAIAWAQEAARFTPATRNGEPVAACKDIRVNFKLRGN